MLYWFEVCTRNRKAEGGAEMALGVSGSLVFCRAQRIRVEAEMRVDTDTLIPSPPPHWLSGDALAQRRPSNESQHSFLLLGHSDSLSSWPLKTSRSEVSLSPDSCVHSIRPSVVMAARVNVYRKCIFSLCLISTLTLFGHFPPLSCHRVGFNLPSINVTTGAA